MDANADGLLSWSELESYFTAAGAALSDEEFTLIVSDMRERIEGLAAPSAQTGSMQHEALASATVAFVIASATASSSAAAVETFVLQSDGNTPVASSFVDR